MSRSAKSRPREPEKIDSFEERLEIIFEELSLAIRGDRPSILLLPYASEYIRAEVERLLEARLGAFGQKLVRFVVSEKQFDLPLLLSRRPDRKKSVYSVLALSMGGGKSSANAYRALNMRRELLVDHHVRALFWVTRAEARTLSRRAPDFWAFRHRVVEFDRLSDLHRLAASFGDGLLPNVQSFHRAAQLHPADAQAWFKLGNCYLDLGMAAQAVRAFGRSLAIAPGDTPVWLGLAHAYRLGMRLPDAIINYRQVLRLEPRNLSAHLSLMACHRLMGRNYLVEAQKARLRPFLEAGSEFDQAVFASLCGDAAQAVKWLGIALEKHQVNLGRIKRDPDFDFIRTDPAFQKLLNTEASPA
jgi:tetratricopeptide (TPR) repeat protein